MLVIGARSTPELRLAETTRFLYEHVRELPSRPLDRLDVLLLGDGLPPAAGYRVMMLLREYTRELRIIVSGSVGPGESLACVAADELVLHPMATLTTALASAPGRGSGVTSLVADLLSDNRERSETSRAILRQADPERVGSSIHTHEWTRHAIVQLAKSRVVPPSLDTEEALLRMLTCTVQETSEPLSRRETRGSGGWNVTNPTPEFERLLFDLHTLYERPLGLLEAPERSPARAVLESEAVLHILSNTDESPEDVRWRRHFDAAVH